jgi:hypothetical protein
LAPYSVDLDQTQHASLSPETNGEYYCHFLSPIPMTTFALVIPNADGGQYGTNTQLISMARSHTASKFNSDPTEILILATILHGPTL